MPPLPGPLAAAFAELTSTGAKRERTQGQLLQAALQVAGSRGVAATTVNDVAAAAGMTPATVYNHFETREALLRRLGGALAVSLCRIIDESCGPIGDGAERMAIGQRRYLWLAAESPAWTLALLDVFAGSPEALVEMQKYPLADLRIGIRQKRFKVPSEALAMDVITGVCTAGMRRIALGMAPPKHDIAVAAAVLRGLGMPAKDAEEIAKRPLPPFSFERGAQDGALVAKRARRV
jgi:AcrR family transcriptional regulator